MARKKATQGRTQTVINPGQAPSIYSNVCEVAVVAGDIRITFREVVEVLKTGMVVRDIFRVYVNEEVGGRLAKILSDSVTAVRANKAKAGSKAP